MEKLHANDPRVVSFFKYYHDKSKKIRDLYCKGEGGVTVILPANLIDYCNAAAGNSGGANPRPCGIRRSCDNPKAFIKLIFTSTQSLADFINSSECNASELSYNRNVKKEKVVRNVKKVTLSMEEISLIAREMMTKKIGNREVLKNLMHETFNAGFEKVDEAREYMYSEMGA